MEYNEIREWLAEQEHIQWEHWSKTLSNELEGVYELLCNDEINKAKAAIIRRVSRWKNNWMPYRELKEDIKDFDREWADKILEHVPIKCPVHQCGGIMQTEERGLPKDFIESEHNDGDEQTPDLVCTNCKALYQFKGFKE